MRKLKHALEGVVAVAAITTLVGCTSGSGNNHEPFVATGSPTPTDTTPTPTDTSTPTPTTTSPTPTAP